MYRFKDLPAINKHFALYWTLPPSFNMPLCRSSPDLISGYDKQTNQFAVVCHVIPRVLSFLAIALFNERQSEIRFGLLSISTAARLIKHKCWRKNRR